MQLTKRTAFLLGLASLVLILCFAVPWQKQNLMFQLLSTVESLSSCGSCLAFLVPLQALARMGDDALVEALVSLCSGLGIQNEDVCVGALESQGPIIAHSLRSISLSRRSASLLCSKILGLCPYPAVPHYSFPLPKPTRNVTVPWSGRRDPVKFVHITDIHVDQYYEPGSEAKCSGPICCRGPVEGVPVMKAGPFGNYRCDTPIKLFDSMLDAIQRYAGDAEGVIFTGDAIDHTVWLSTKDEVISSVSLAYDKLSSLNNTIYGAIGNHDVHPTNSFPRATSSFAHLSDWTFDLHSKYWKHYIGSEAANSARHQSGSYSVVHANTNLRIISFNSNYAYKANFWLYDSDVWDPDPNGLFRWLANELQAAEDAGQRAWIIAHMSTGKSDFMQDQSAIFDQIVQRYHKTLALQLYGHSHTAEFEIGYSTYARQDASTATSISLIAPALTPSSGNPTFRILEVDPDSFALMDFIEVIANVTSPTFQHGPEWIPYYSAREAYGKLLFDRPLAAHEPLDAPFWHRVTEIFEDSDDAFQLFMKHRTRGAVKPRCSTDFCKMRWLSALRAARSEYNGQAQGPQRPFKKRSLTGLQGGNEEEDWPGDHACSHRIDSAPSIIKSISQSASRSDIVFKTWQQYRSRSRWLGHASPGKRQRW